jgi:hypothetical protein
LGVELAANLGFNPRVIPGVFHAQDLSAGMVARGRAEHGRRMPSHILGGASAAGTVNQLISLQKSNADSAGVGYVAGALGDQVQAAIHIPIGSRESVLNLNKGSERLRVHTTLLNGKSVGKQRLKGLLIEVGTGTHITKGTIAENEMPRQFWDLSTFSPAIEPFRRTP